MPDILNGSSDDAATTCGADNVVEGVVGKEFHDSGGYGGEGALAGFDEIGG